MGHTFDARNIEIWVYAFYMLNVAHVKNADRHQIVHTDREYE